MSAAHLLNWNSVIIEDGADTKSRTRDLLITSQLLYQLSYVGIFKNHTSIMAAIALIKGANNNSG